MVQEASFEIVPVGSAPGTRLVPGRGTLKVTINGTTYTLDSSRNVLNAAGARIGTVDDSGSLVASNGSIIARNAVDPLTLIGIGSGTGIGAGACLLYTSPSPRDRG